MTRAGPHSGFTLIELMIVVAIIAVLSALAIPNLLRSRMAANESSAIAQCRSYGEAQDIYRRTDWDYDGVHEYATAVSGANSLYTNDPTKPGDLVLVDKAFAIAVGDPGSAHAKMGYVFSVLTGQGSTAPAGARDYVVAGNMTLGYGLSAIPASWDNTGRNTFQINQTGTVYQKDRGVNTGHLSTYGPDTTWIVP